jgi:hypothetical protein
MTATTSESPVEVVTPEGRTSTILKRDALGLSALFFERARQFPDEANRFRLSRLEAAGLPPRALRRARALFAH